jgi:putative FmdB family regulatory protein
MIFWEAVTGRHGAQEGAFVPVYQYACTECGEQLEVRQSFTDDPLTVCPACEGRLRKVLSAVGVVFKGSGFYRTDSRASSGSGPSGGSTSSGSNSSGSGSSGSSGSGTASDSPGTTASGGDSGGSAKEGAPTSSSSSKESPTSTSSKHRAA